MEIRAVRFIFSCLWGACLSVSLTACMPDPTNPLGLSRSNSNDTTVRFPPVTFPTNTPSNTDGKNETKPEFNWHGDESGYTFADAASSDEFREYVSNSFLECHEDGCPRGVGLLLFYQADAQKIGRCTAFLVESDVVATNSHCIPQDLKAPRTFATNRIYIVLPNRTEIEVTNTVFASKIESKDQFHQDYALLKLRYPVDTFSVMKVSREGLQHNSEVKIWNVNAASSMNNYTGRNMFSLNQTKCKVSQGLGLFPMFKDNQSPLATFTNCNIIEGNSGSPVVANDGSVRAILSAYFLIEHTPVGGIMQAEDIAKVPRVAIATNFSCVKDFSKDAPALASSCKADISKAAYFAEFKSNYKEALLRAGSGLEVEAKASAEKWLSENSKIIKWKMIPASTSPESEKFYKDFYATPPVRAAIDCVQPPAQWKKQFQTAFIFYKSKATLKFQNFIWGVSVGADQNFNFFPKSAALKMESIELEIDPSTIVSKGKATVSGATVFNILGKEFRIPIIPHDVPMCH